YNLTSLMEITRKMLKEKDYELTASAEHLIRSHLQETLHKKPLHFSNARYVRNVIEKAIRKQAIRLMSTQSLSPTLIKQITKEDARIAKEHVLIIAVKKANVTDHHFESSVDELRSLSHTAGADVIEVVTQNRVQIHPVTYVGEGKVEEIRQLVEAHDIHLVIA